MASIEAENLEIWLLDHQDDLSTDDVDTVQRAVFIIRETHTE